MSDENSNVEFTESTFEKEVTTADGATRVERWGARVYQTTNPAALSQHVHSAMNEGFPDSVRFSVTNRDVLYVMVIKWRRD